MDHAARPDLATADGHDRHVPSDAKDILSAGHEGVYRWAAEHLVRPGTCMLDLGCGTGYGAPLMVAAGARYDGIDGSPAAIEYARASYSQANARFFLADLMEPLPPEIVPRSYDVVFSSEVLEHVVDPFAFVRAMAGCLRDEGTCFVGTPNRLWSKANMPRGELLAASHVMEFTPPALLALLRTVFDEVSLLFRRLPPGAARSVLPTAGRPRLIRGALALADEVAPTGVMRWRGALSRRKDSREWSPQDIAWLTADDPQLDTAQCVGLAAVCRRPLR